MFYIDEEYKCHASNPDGVYRAIDKDLFKDKCDTFIEGHIFVPEGESYVGKDGTVYTGDQMTVWKDYNELDAAQRKYEQENLADAEKALAILLGGAV